MKFHKIYNRETSISHIEKTLSETEKRLGVYITLHDLLNAFSLPDGSSIKTLNRHLHACPYCVAGRYSEPKWSAYCPRDCSQESDLITINQAKPYTKTCWKGVFEIVIPLLRGKTVVGALFVGAWRGKIPDNSILPDKYLKMHAKLPDIPSSAEIHNLIDVLSAIGQGLVSQMEQVEATNNDAPGRKEKIIGFIHENSHKPVKLADLARHLCLSPSRTSHIVNELFDMPFKQLLIRERMSRARDMLLAEWPDMSAVAEAAGYENIHYFSTAFKKWHGVPPGRFKRENQPQNQAKTNTSGNLK